MITPQETLPTGDNTFVAGAISVFLKFIYDPIAWLTAALITVNFFYLWFNRRTVKILEQQYLDSIEPIIFLHTQPLQTRDLTFWADLVIECSPNAAPAFLVDGELFLTSNNGTKLWSLDLKGYASHLNPGTKLNITINGTAQRPVDLAGAAIEGYFWYRDAKELQEYFRVQERDSTYIITSQRIKATTTWSRRIKTFANKWLRRFKIGTTTTWSRRIKTFTNKWSRRNQKP